MIIQKALNSKAFGMQFLGSSRTIQLWVITLVFFLSLLAARELGAYLRGLHLERRPQTVGAPVSEDVGSDSFSINTVLGLLALLVGFTFSVSLGRFDDRRTLVVREANSLGTMWLRTDLLGAADGERVRSVLRRYINARVDFGQARGAKNEAEQYARTVSLHGELWAAVMKAVSSFRDTPRASLVVLTTNESIDLAAERFAVRQSHIPFRILRMLYVFSLLAALLLGYERGYQRISTTMLLLLFSLAVGLVLDLDLPGTGSVHVPQDPMLDLQRTVTPHTGVSQSRL